MREAIGLDLYNWCVSGHVLKTLTGMRVDAYNLPCVLILEIEDESDSDGEEL